MNSPTEHHAFPLDDDHLLQWFDNATMHRARAYLQAGKVVKLEYSDDLSQISAQVWGAAFSPYRQNIVLAQTAAGWSLRDSCSCPVGHRCKHILAVLLRLKRDYAQQQLRIKQLPQLKLDNWFNELEQLQQPARTDSSDTVLYLLSYGQAGLQLYPRRVRAMKKGGFTKGQAIGKYDLVSPQPPVWLSESDYQLLTLFRSHNLAEQSVLEDNWGYQLLQQLLATGRCMFSEARYPLSWGEQRPLELSWHASKAGQQLGWQVGAEHNSVLVFTEPACYLDTDNYQLGVLNTPLSGRELKLLSKMPPAPAALLQSRLGRLQQLLPKISLPMPSGLGVEQINVQPTPVLQLKMLPRLNKGRQEPVALLSFDYAKQRLPLDLQASQTEVQQDQQTYFVKRHRATETAALELLLDLQLLSLPPLAAPHQQQAAFGVGDGPDNPELWQPLLQQLDSLRDDGWLVEQASDFNLDILAVTPYLQVQDGKKSGFELGIQVDIDGQQVPLLPLISQWLRQNGVPSSDQQIWLSLPQGKLALPMSLIQPLIDTIIELLNLQKAPLTLELPDYKAAILPPPGAAEIQYLNANRLASLNQQLHNFSGITDVSLPTNLQATLRAYQQQGLNWLTFLKQYGLGGILADDMGLGKTLQTLSFILKQYQQGDLKQPALIVCPTSLLGNWQQEARRFTPDLKVLQIYGPKRRPLFDELGDYQLIVTSYPLLVRDIALYRQHRFSVVVLDEAQHIKNAGSQAAQSVRVLHRDFSLALTGTPLENHLGELKSLFDFVLPGLLGTEQHFSQVYRKPIEKHGDAERAHVLRQKIAPFMLRRTKSQVATELPEKTEIVQLLELEADQRNLYESIRLIMETKVRELFVRKGVAASQIEFLDALLKLRQVCCDARLVPIEQAQSVRHNAKLQWLRDTLPEMLEEGRRILLFSQFASMLHLIEQELQYMGISYSKLTGQTKQRQQQIDAFQQGETEVFLISLKAGGTGLNLTAADTVIHYDPWWNPAAEQQATDRAHRIGQDKAVFVYKLIARNTVEEKVQLLQSFKQGLADQMLGGSKGQVWQGNATDLLSLFSTDE
ncbi:DEAD/DEAH box helicase [Arsukibacterium sp. MJ3]|uniref:DEAD/DEAH box helicase n=1 Tax=Arsukibacterium sp. MJ3 TaxID=1632859 RepID=UPI000A6011A8|nr:DEAD/DEAH box helicase [Arsukibacterium sp. MJ3]